MKTNKYNGRSLSEVKSNYMQKDWYVRYNCCLFASENGVIIDAEIWDLLGFDKEEAIASFNSRH